MQPKLSNEMTTPLIITRSNMLRSVAPDTVLSCTRANMHASAGTSCNLNGQAYVPRDVNLGSFKKKLIYCTNKTVNMIHEFLLETSRSYFILWSYFLSKNVNILYLYPFQFILHYIMLWRIYMPNIWSFDSFPSLIVLSLAGESLTFPWFWEMFIHPQ